MVDYCINIKQGSFHSENGMPVEDAAAVCSDGKLFAAVLCDGCGSLEGGRVASKLIANGLSKFLVKSNFNFYDNYRFLCNIISDYVESLLNEYADKNEIESNQLGSTFQAVLVNVDNNDTIAFFLGDGETLWKQQGDQEFKLFSGAERIGDRTYVSMNSNWKEHIRCIKWIDKENEDRVQEILLKTDGMNENKGDDASYIFLKL